MELPTELLETISSKRVQVYQTCAGAWRLVPEPVKQARRDGTTCEAVAACGQLDVLKWLRANNCPWDQLTCAAAAEHGHLHVLRWACENGCPWREDTCTSAAEHGHLALLQWARANECPWNTWTCARAALEGQLGILKWAREQGCPWDQWQTLWCVQVAAQNRAAVNQDVTKSASFARSALYSGTSRAAAAVAISARTAQNRAT